VYLGSELRTRLARPALAAVLAHERAHLQRGDVATRVLARALVGFHLPWVGRAILNEYDLAIEQACDVEASRAVHDPLVVAQALLDATRLADTPREHGLAAAAGPALEARIHALCDPSWRSIQRSVPWIAAASIATLALGVVLDRRVHDIAESLVGLLGR
jgi:beta-lactamase regulating signal transducer with metallopeptidase domain